MSNIKVSVVVPVYNVEQYLNRCLDSLVNQTLDDIEILVINDGSNDNSQTIIDDYAERYPNKIRSFTKENGGLSDARNFGVEKAIGEYIGFIDSDDYVDFDMYERMYQKAVDTGAEVVCCPLTHEYENRTRKTFYNEVYFGESVKNNPQIMTYANSFAHNKIYQRAFWQKNQFLFPLRQWFEDSYLIYNVLLAANKVELVNFPFVHYMRDREESITNQFDMRLFDIFKSVESIVGFYKEYGVFNEIKSEVEYICLRHLTARIKHLRRAPVRADARRFIREMVAFLNENFSDWRKNHFLQIKTSDGFHDKFVKILYRSEKLMLLYVSAPKWVISMSQCLVTLLKKIRKLHLPTSKKKAEKNKETKRYYIQQNGMAVLQEVQTILKELGIVSFADFGTCLGLVREGHLLEHDLDMDIGVIASPTERERIRIALERRGYKLWRQYRYLGNPVEDSYHYRRIKVDLNFYEMTDEYSRTWLFYMKPGAIYENSWTRHVVQMTYSPITGIKYEEFDGCSIALPADPELLMTEKYGPSWRTPDKGWIYWESPAAEKLEETGNFKTFEYSGSVYIDQEEDFATKNAEKLSVIRELQQYELVIMEELDRVCKKLAIPYYLGEGTLLGAVRHGGFISWNPNVTIWMHRADYDKFLQEASSVLGEQFILQNGTVTKNYFVPFIKMRLLNDNVFYNKKNILLTENAGPFIDIYPLDSAPANKTKKLATAKKKSLLYKIALYFKHKNGSANSLGRKIAFVYSCLVPKKILYKQFMGALTKYNAPDNDYYVCLASKYGAQKVTFPKAWFEEPRYISFEGKEFPVPYKAELVLRQIYNNYTRPTPSYSRPLKCDFIHCEDAENT